MKNLFSKLPSSGSSRRLRANGSWTVFDWCATGITLATVQATKGRLVLQNSAFLEWPNGLDPLAQPEDRGAWLKLQCEQRSIGNRNVVLLLPRNLVQIRLLKFPRVTDEELEKLVALQMESRTGSGSESLAWDLLIHPEFETDERFVTVLTISERSLNAMVNAMRAAGCTLSVVTCGDLCINRLKADAGEPAKASPASTQFFVLTNRSKLEVQVVRNSFPVASATLSTDPNESCRPDQLASHANSLAYRLNAGLPEAWRVDRIDHYHVAGSNAEQLAAALHRGGAHGEVINRDEREPRILATVAGLCSSVRLPDPVRPQRVLQRQTATRSMIRLAACLLGLAAIGGVYVQSVMAESASELARLQSQRDQLSDYAQRGQSVVQTASAINAWKNETRNCSQELAAVLASIKSPDDIIVTRVQMEHQPDGEPPVIRLDGMVKSSEILKSLHQSLMQTPQVQAIRPQGVEPAPEDAALPIQFRLELVLADKTSE